jgi:acyl carrier protein
MKKNHIDHGDVMTDTILETLAQYIAAEFLKQSNRVIGPDDPLLSSGLVDSFHLVDLSLFVEKNFGVRIDDTELNASTFDTLNQLTAFIKGRQ